MQRHGCAADFVHELLATRLNFIQIRRTKRCVGGSGKNQIRDFKIAHRPVIWRGERVDFLCDA